MLMRITFSAPILLEYLAKDEEAAPAGRKAEARMAIADGDEGSAAVASASTPLGDVSTAENHLLTPEARDSAAQHTLGAAHADELWYGKQEPDEGIWSLLGSTHCSDLEWSAGDGDNGDITAGASIHDMSSSDSSTRKASSDSKPTRKPKKRYRAEVLLLRDSVAELERELGAIKSHQESAESEWSIENKEGSAMQKWQKVARSEIQATARARLENAKLKVSVETHAKYSRELQKLLTQLSGGEAELLDHHQLSQQPEIALSRSTAKEIEIYDQLVKSIDARVCDLQAASTVPELADINSARAIQQQATISDFTIQLNEEQALCIDLVDRYIVPFDFQAVALVLWEYVLSRVLKLTNRLTHVSIRIACGSVTVPK